MIYIVAGLLLCLSLNSVSFRIFPLRRRVSQSISKRPLRSLAKHASQQSDTKQDESPLPVPRLNADIPTLMRWIEVHGGLFHAKVVQTKEGWSLVSSKAFGRDDIIIKIPKRLCIFTDPDEMEVPLSTNAQKVIMSLHESNWRARLAIAILSERVKPDSFYKPYIRNLPFEFWGMPLFFSSSEFRYVIRIIDIIWFLFFLN